MNYWSIKLPYIDCAIEDNQLIGTDFNMQTEVWETYFNSGESGAETETVSKLSSNNEYLNYNIVYGNSDKEGSYVGQVYPHFTEDPEALQGGEAYGIVVSQGDIDIPTFSNFGGASDTNWDQIAEVNYQGEVGLIDENWRRYSDDETFSDRLSSVFLDLSNQLSNETNKGDPIFIFRKTNEKPININKISPIDSMNVEIVSETQPSVTATTSVSAGSY